MVNFLIENIVAIIFGIATVILTIITIRLKMKEVQMKVYDIVGEGRQVMLFLTRDSMLLSASTMYQRGEKGDIIWGQCVGCRDYSKDARSLILKGAEKGIGYKYIVNSYAPTARQIKDLYESISNSEVVEGKDNTISLQGLSDKEVIITFPGIENYTAIRVIDKNFVKIIKDWFDKRFDKIKKKKED